jgi:hypothetical protein
MAEKYAGIKRGPLFRLFKATIEEDGIEYPANIPRWPRIDVDDMIKYLIARDARIAETKLRIADEEAAKEAAALPINERIDINTMFLIL